MFGFLPQKWSRVTDASQLGQSKGARVGLTLANITTSALINIWMFYYGYELWLNSLSFRSYDELMWNVPQRIRGAVLYLQLS